MTDRFPELDDADRATAAALEQAFAGLALDRPSPVTMQAQDDGTAALLAAAFEPLVLSAPAPGSAADGTDHADLTDPEADDARGRVVALPRRRRRLLRTLGWPATAAAACLVAAVAVLAPSGSSTAWAAEPRTPTSADRTGIDAACAAPLTRGPGALQASGRAAPGTAPTGVATGAGAGGAIDLPDRLPPLVALDVRGDLAFAVYQDRTWTVSCVVRAAGDRWQDEGVQVGPGPATQTPGVVGGGGVTSLEDGEQVTTLSGAVPAGTTRVTFRLDDGTQVEASVVGSTWAAWFPGDRRIAPASLTAYDATGTPRRL